MTSHDEEKAATHIKEDTKGTHILSEADLEDLAIKHGFKPEDGRIVVDPEEACREFGEEQFLSLQIGRSLKLNKKGDKVLWPQPSNDPLDPLNWSDTKKNIQLLIITMAAFVPDFCSAIGIAGLFPISETFGSDTTHVNNLTSNWSIFMLGWGGILAIILIKRFGRLPVLFWSQFIGLGFLIGCAAAPNLNTYAAFRILNATFNTAPQITGLFTVCDMYFFHLQARKLNLWTFGFILSPFVSPSILGLMIAKTGSWRDAYYVGVGYCGLVVLLLAFLAEETMYDRDVVPFPPRPTTGLRYRVETLLGVTGWKMRKHRYTWTQAFSHVFDLVWRPHCFLMLLYVGVFFGFSIGINVTATVFTSTPEPVGYGYTQYATSCLYFTPIVAVILAEAFSRYFNDWLTDFLVKRNSGVFVSEMRLWICYVIMPFYIAGFLLLGATFQNQLSPAGIVFGWGLAEFAVFVNTVAGYNYLNNCFPTRQGEASQNSIQNVSALVNLARVLGGFSVPYFQVPMSLDKGPLAVFGMEAGVGFVLFILIVPLLQIKGSWLRQTFSIHHAGGDAKK